MRPAPDSAVRACPMRRTGIVRGEAGSRLPPVPFAPVGVCSSSPTMLVPREEGEGVGRAHGTGAEGGNEFFTVVSHEVVAGGEVHRLARTLTRHRSEGVFSRFRTHGVCNHGIVENGQRASSSTGSGGKRRGRDKGAERDEGFTGTT
jgi:hypothetical protein